MHLAVVTTYPHAAALFLVRHVLQIVLLVLSWTILLYSSYLMTILFAGLFRRYRAPQIRRPKTRFAVVVPAHNEAHVLDPLLRNLAQLRYPKSLYKVFVIADNCSDDTPGVARSRGATVLVRRNSVEKGKGHALEYAFQRILVGDQYDAVVVVDADNLLELDFLRQMNNHLLSGHEVIQSRKDVKNPDDGVLAMLKTLFVWTSNRFWFLAKHNLGCSSVLLGSGMCIATSVLKRFGWGAHSLTEDFEFTAKALSEGVRVHWADEAVIYEEEPTTFRQVWNQHARWARGQNYVLFRYGTKLFFDGIMRAEPVKVEGALQLAQSVFPVLSLAVGMMSYFGMWLGIPTVVGHIPPWVGIAASMLQYAAPPVAYWLDGLRNPFPLRYVWLYPVFVYSWILVNVYAIFTYRATVWHVTEHRRPLSIAEVAQGRNQN